MFWNRLCILLLFVVALICELTTSVYARETAHSGIYAGGFINVVSGKTELTRELINVNSSPQKLPSIRPKGFGGGLFAGYGFVTEGMLYFAPEIYGSFSTADDSTQFKTTGIDASIKTSLESTFGFAGRFGVLLGDALTYAKLGIVTSKWKVRSIENSTPNSPDSRSSTKTFKGFEIGAGVAAPASIINDNLVFGTEYSFTKYQSESLKITHPNKFKITNMKANTHTISLRVSYKITGDLFSQPNERRRDSL